ncbi:MAG TPA: hypothetical protein VD999_00205 [Vitreimonas sp.]|nr:hypothetical protein [Vitreimonas sp.]
MVVWLLLSAWLLGILIAKWWLPDFSGLAKITIGHVLGVIIVSWLTLLSVACCGYSGGIYLAATVQTLILIGWGSYTIRTWHQSRQSQLKLKKVWSKLDASLISFTLFWSLILVPLFVTRMFLVRADGWYSGGGSWADLALHSTQISFFAQQSTLDLRNPIFVTSNLTYPFLINFYTSLWVRAGLTLPSSLLLSGLSLVLSLIIIFHEVLRKVLKSATPVWLWSLLFFFNGGLGWLSVFSGQESVVTRDVTNWSEHGYYWTNIITTYLLPQRGWLIGLPLYGLCLWAWWEVWHKPATQQRQLLIMAALIGSLPLFHFHTFLVLIGLSIGLGSCLWWQRKISPSVAGGAGLIIVMLSVPQLWWQLTQGGSTHFVSWHPGWLVEEEGLLWFWLKNVGVFLPILGLATGWLFLRSKNSFWQATMSLSLISFMIVNLISLQPYLWDNMKIMLLNYALFCAVCSLYLADSWATKPWAKGVVPFIVIMCCLSGVMSVLHESRTQWQIASPLELEVATLIKTHTPPGSTFLIAPSHKHLVPMIAGRPVVMGYPGWLWTHGYEYQNIEKDVATMYQGEKNASQLLHTYGVQYIFVGPDEKNAWKVNEGFLNAQFPVIVEHGQYRIYQVL